jgi:glycosyltransferase involved in cell wall biosynthesis
LLEAYSSLSIPHLHLLFVGSGPLENKLKTAGHKYENVHFMDFQNQSQMPAVYQAADLFCLPSAGPGETWGLAVNEAMASGKAILASDKAGAAVDLVKRSYNGAIFKGGDVNDLAKTLGYLLNCGRDALITMGVNSRRSIEDWTYEKQVTAIETAVTNG